MTAPRGYLADELESRFPPAVRQRGERVFDAGLVATLRQTEGGWTAVVRSESAEGRRYAVVIDAIGGDALSGIFAGQREAVPARWRFGFRCSCPVGTDCKHAVAAVLAILERESASGRAEARAAGYGAPFRDRPAPATPPAADLASWRTAYWLGKRTGAWSLRGMEGGWYVSRILVRRNADGSPGRCKRWTPAYAGALLPAGAGPLEDCLRSYGGEEAPVAAAGIKAASLPHAALHFSDGNEPASARELPVLPAGRALLSFLPVRLDGDSVLWTPSLAFIRADGSPCAPVRAAMRCSGGMLYPSGDALVAALAGPFARADAAEALGLPAGEAPAMDRDGAVALGAALEARCDGELSVRLPPARIVREKLAPEPELVLEPRFGGPLAGELRCELRFTYRGAALGDGACGLETRDDELRVLARDPEAESAWKRRLSGILGARSMGRERPSGSVGGLQWDLAISLGEFASAHLEALRQAGFTLAVRTGGKKHAVQAGRLAASAIASGVDWFSASLRLDVDGRGMPLDGSVTWMGAALVMAGDDLVSLPERDAGFLSLFARAHSTAVPAGSTDRITREVRVDARDLALVAALHELSDDADKPLTASRAALLASVSDLAPAESTPAPDGLRAELRPYQAAGYAWLMRLARAGLGALLADDMGLGKTLQAIAAMLALSRDGLLKPALVVAPVTVLSNWEAELARFAPSLKTARHHGPGRPRDRESLIASFLHADIVLTSYQTLRSDMALFSGTELGLALLDEAQAVKNPASAMARATRALKARCRLALTGTPVENRPLDLWSHFAFLNPGLLGTRKDFQERCERPIAEGDAAALESLRRRTAPFVLRRSKEGVLAELPPKEEIVRRVDMGGAQAGFYEALRKQCEAGVQRTVGERGLERSSLFVLEALLRLRQAAIHPALIDERHAAAGGAKIDDAAALVLGLADEGHRTLVFSQFTSALALLGERLDAAGLAHEYLDGQTRDRAERIARFQAGSGGGAFLLSLKAGGVGVNLTNADYVILLDPWWNPAVESQAVDRAHRMGQTRPVTVYRLVTGGTVEEKVLALQERKRDLVDGLVSGASDGLAGLSGSELLDLFS